MEFIADLHVHSKYSIATGKSADLEHMEKKALLKGIGLVGTGDFTHPLWRRELRSNLIPCGKGVFRLNPQKTYLSDKQSFERISRGNDNLHTDTPVVRFMITGEISCIYKRLGRTRKVHCLILLPTLKAADDISNELSKIGNIESDGRPILKLDSRDLLEICLTHCPDSLLIPAHIWTPHFSLFGSKSGFESVEECFDDLSSHIHALETGLSSDPMMNWRISRLDKYNLISNSDAHSPENLGREATIFNCGIDYTSVYNAITAVKREDLAGTIEFFPQEGKYYMDGHRKCNICFSPNDTKQAEGACPVCGRQVTQGVLHRIDDMADRSEGFVPIDAKPYECLIPLKQLISAVIGMGVRTKSVDNIYSRIIYSIGPEFHILRSADPAKIRNIMSGCLQENENVADKLVDAIMKIRRGEADITPGYDGKYGEISAL